MVRSRSLSILNLAGDVFSPLSPPLRPIDNDAINDSRSSGAAREAQGGVKETWIAGIGAIFSLVGFEQSRDQSVD
jgi:hypothetical protein